MGLGDSLKKAQSAWSTGGLSEMGGKGGGGGQSNLEAGEAYYQALLKQVQGLKGDPRIMDEVLKQRSLGTQYADERSTSREQSLSDLANILAKSQQTQLMDRIPDIAEQANLKGIFRSTGTGNAVAREAGNLTRDTSHQIALQGLQDREAGLADRAGVNQAYLQGRWSPLQRDMSLDDYMLQARQAQMMGALGQPAQQGSGKGGGALQGGIGGATAGASFGPWGALIGGGLGAVAGGQASK
jgi:hypothetical protein